MKSSLLQQTLKTATVEFGGVGLHSGKEVAIKILPAAVDSGIVFQCKNDKNKQIRAIYSNVSNTNYCTQIHDNNYTVSTIEHLMAALSASSIHNAVIEINGGQEIPIIDGSSIPFLKVLQDTGIIGQDKTAPFISIQHPIQVSLYGKCASLLPLPEPSTELCLPELAVTVEVDFGEKLPGKYWHSSFLSEFENSVARARTFTFADEVISLRNAGLASGGSLDNAVVFENGKALNPEGLRFSDEWVRHKALDCFGDLGLAGMPIHGHYVGIKPGHSISLLLLQKLFSDKGNYKIIF